MQLAFIIRAVHKLRNREIYDTVYRSVRRAQRKLNKEERLYEPLRSAEKYGRRRGYILLAVVTTIRCAMVKENNNPDTLMKTYEDFHSADKLKEVYGLLKESISLKDVVEFCVGFQVYDFLIYEYPMH